ncbi:NifB/NifX family molybdenum-iron cluster-binding protein [Rhodospirillum rubrum]|uniref:Nitrogen fixation-related protein n=1 Tax=Rhodospirillum rubrum (strain ATCC 11170 / ATH 1.1.1 / DSM 467 / LMG 4362 / NCIMB 8255 / S1) TaxID=269796 RepID=Q2RSW1_RHORT|nr:NifB/NifX family molybdenum-iron cluster-binding protein [Rhodospirillum rubrum]ABC22784.1 nitrogen fixation-related protein [Rhodospirillum rubrum ATCC 11170]AEO48505.1 nitrogen fixation-like protein [Rhodospirillum rubrum F11]MBK5954381.1 nitrogen fixation protein [Rhodospirillum rubrum]QXG78773.1 nitrogen fixation protein [Rhodospirillum rubrum]HAQ01493.1 nitrogen fixation protein [Rhodospirillum rubrum]
MRIGISSQDFLTVSGHAGRARHFLIFETSADGALGAPSRLELPPDKVLHAFGDDGPHPLYDLDVVVTAGAGGHFVSRMEARGVRVVFCAEIPATEAARQVASGEPASSPAPLAQECCQP